MNDAVTLVPRSVNSLPMTFGQILDRIFHLMRANMRVFLTVASVPAGAMVAFYGMIAGILFLNGALSAPPQLFGPHKVGWIIFPAFALGALALMLVFAVYEAAATHAALQADAGGHVSFSEAYGVARRNAGRYVGLAILRGLLIALPTLLSLVVILGAGVVFYLMGSGGVHPGALFLLLPLAILLYAGTLVYALVTGLRLSLAYPASLEESLAPGSALKRSAQLTQSVKGRIFLVLLVVYAIAYAALLVLEAVCLAIVALGFFAFTATHLHVTTPWMFGGISIFTACAILVMFVWTALIWASYATALAVVYHDQRNRSASVLLTPSSVTPV